MAASETIIGEEWQARSREQARSYKAMTLPIASMRGQDMVSLDKMTLHFACHRQHRPQLIGMHGARARMAPAAGWRSASTTTTWRRWGCRRAHRVGARQARPSRSCPQGSFSWRSCGA
jgi:hypothetical protein